MKLDLDHLERLAHVSADGEIPTEDGSRLAYIYANSLLQTVAEIRRLRKELEWIQKNAPTYTPLPALTKLGFARNFVVEAKQRAMTALAGF